jgi:hypothetical protein
VNGKRTVIKLVISALYFNSNIAYIYIYIHTRTRTNIPPSNIDATRARPHKRTHARMHERPYTRTHARTHARTFKIKSPKAVTRRYIHKHVYKRVFVSCPGVPTQQGCIIHQALMCQHEPLLKVNTNKHICSTVVNCPQVPQKV